MCIRDRNTVETMGKNSREVLEQKFAPNTHYETLMKLFESVTATKPVK